MELWLYSVKLWQPLKFLPYSVLQVKRDKLFIIMFWSQSVGLKGYTSFIWSFLAYAGYDTATHKLDPPLDDALLEWYFQVANIS